ncbi:MAG: glycosyltransferase family 39 protein, partial [Candidatus Acidiferrales bacterium]
ALSGVAIGAATAAASILFLVRGIPHPGDISNALSQHPEAYTLALGHMQDLTLLAFAYLRVPLLMAAIAFLAGAVGAMRFEGKRAFLAIAVMMILLLHAARLAMVKFDPYLSSRPLAEKLLESPKGELILGDQYYTFSSIIFYTNRSAYILNGRVNNLEYGSNAPGAPQVFIDDSRFVQLWSSPERYYLVAEGPAVPRIESLTGGTNLHIVAESGGKHIFSNLPLASGESTVR